MVSSNDISNIKCILNYKGNIMKEWNWGLIAVGILTVIIWYGIFTIGIIPVVCWIVVFASIIALWLRLSGRA